jgi:hypothetical protein
VDEVQGWLQKLEQLRGKSDATPEVKARIQEHIVTARLWLDWMGG